MTYYTYPPSTATGSGIPKYPTFASFPSPVTAGNGALAIALDTDILYISNGVVWEPIAGPGTVLGVGTFDSGTPSSNGAHIDSNLLIMQSASATNPGEVNTGTQTFAGNKTFNGRISAANLSGQNTGDADVVFRPGGVQGGVVYNNWSDLYAAIVGLDIANVYVTFDNSIQSIVIPAGTYDLINVRFQAALGTSLTSSIIVTLANGCVFSNFPGVENLITLVSASSSPVFVPPDNYLVGIQFAGALASNTGAPMIAVPANFTMYLILLSDSTVSGQAGFPLISLGSNATLVVLCAEAVTFGDYSVSGGATEILEVIVENPNVNLTNPQSAFTGTFVVSYPASATNMTFGSNLGDTVYANASGVGTVLPGDTTNAKVFLSEKSIAGSPQAPVWSTVSAGDITGTIQVNQGGTGITSGTSGGIPYFSSTSTIASSALLTANQLIKGGGAGVAPSTLTAGSQFQVLVMGATTPGYGQVNLASAVAITGTLPIGNGGTGVTSVTTAPTATAFAGWDANKNLSSNNFLEGYTTTATAAGTTTLTVASTELQFFTGSTTQTVILPLTSTLVLGFSFKIVNNSTGTILVNSSGGNLVQTLQGSTWSTVTCILTSGTTAASWSSRASTTAAGITALTGDVTATGPGSVAASIAATSNATLTTLSALTTASSLASVGTITTGVWNGTKIDVAHGGTNLTSGTSGGILGFTGSTTLASSAALTANQLIIGGGAGATPSTLAAGTQGQILQMNATPIPAWTTIAAPTVQKFTSGSGTYTTPANVKWITVEMIGGGGGGAAGFNSGGSSAQNGGAGGNTTFGSSFLTANGGGGGTFGLSTGGTATIGAGAVGTAIQGGPGGGVFNNNNVAASAPSGGVGASSPFGGGGAGQPNGAGTASIANTGAGGGGGAYTAAATGADSGGGGAAGGYIKAIVTPVSATYSYSVGAAGAAGSASAGGATGGFNGGAGASGYIIITEYYI